MTDLLVACRGRWPASGLYLVRPGAVPTSALELQDAIFDPSALVRHPHQPVVYGTSGSDPGWLTAWRKSDGVYQRIDHTTSDGEEPCHVAVDESGRLLVATNYTTGSLAVVGLESDGTFSRRRTLIPLPGNGSGADPSRQDGPHPHQAVFTRSESGAVLLLVTDLGADVIRRYLVDPSAHPAQALTPDGVLAVPDGTGPRHLALFDDGRRLAVGGELAQTVVIRNLDPSSDIDAVVPSTKHPWPSRTRHFRNHVGDLTRTPDGAHVIVANRGYDTLGVVRLTGEPALVAEVDAGVKWPQHLGFDGALLWVAGWDSGRINSFTWTNNSLLHNNSPIGCDQPGWILLETDRPSSGTF